MSKLKWIPRSVGVSILAVLLSSYVLAYCNTSLFGLPWGFSKTASGGITVLAVLPSNFGQAPPEDARTVSLKDFSDLTSPFWGSVSPTADVPFGEKDKNPSWRSPESKEGLTWLVNLAKDPVGYWLKNDPDGGGGPAGTAVRMWTKNSASLKSDGYGSAEDVWKTLRDDPAKARELCIKYQEGRYVVQDEGWPQTTKVCGFLPDSEFWDPRLFSSSELGGEWGKVGVTGTQVGSREQIPLDVAILLLEAGGFSKGFIKECLTNMCSEAGGSVSGVQLQTGDYDSAMFKLYYPDGAYKQLDQVNAKVFFVRDTIWMLADDGHVLEWVNGYPDEAWLKNNKVPIGCLRGGRDLNFVVHGQYVYEQQQKDPKKAQMQLDAVRYTTSLFGFYSYPQGPSDKFKSHPDWQKEYDRAYAACGNTAGANMMANYVIVQQIMSKELLPDYEKWCTKNGVVSSINTPWMPSTKLAEYGVDPKANSFPTPCQVYIDLWLKGDPLVLKFFSGGIKPDTPEDQEYQKHIRDEFAKQIINYLDIHPTAFGFFQKPEFVWLMQSGVDTPKVQALKDKVEVMMKAAAEKDVWVQERVKNPVKYTPDYLGVANTYRMNCFGYAWDKSKGWVFVGFNLVMADLPKIAGLPALPPSQPASTASAPSKDASLGPSGSPGDPRTQAEQDKEAGPANPVPYAKEAEEQYVAAAMGLADSYASYVEALNIPTTMAEFEHYAKEHPGTPLDSLLPMLQTVPSRLRSRVELQNWINKVDRQRFMCLFGFSSSRLSQYPTFSWLGSMAVPGSVRMDLACIPIVIVALALMLAPSLPIGRKSRLPKLKVFGKRTRRRY